MLSLRLCAIALAISLWSVLTFAAEPTGTTIRAGNSIDLFQAWPKIAQAPKSDLATIEFLIRPDADAINRPRSFVITLSDRGGRDTAGLSLTMTEGVMRAHVFGTGLRGNSKLAADKWTHVALGINSKTINKQATLWIDGEQVAQELVLEHWPKSFETAQMLSDRWNQGRVFSGQLGDVRISRTIRYTKPFAFPTSLPHDEDTVLHFAGDQLPLE